ncbi:Flp pilus assembly protein CpaB [Arthrobacter sp. AFG20]|uniref:Flp pilus assembly protein CpaB n=1 Tax=Arthrobacter sp. AFG20 TaxID=1688671 RepID=UPI000C9E016F|nr:Flp pilus assembly protein CpaB [Arthrobacter sp. AFG20]PNH81144.1 Flp pilus assembly protein CpaB [Arthrobacter sp. AFG20]
MKSRVIASVAAVLLAALGTVLLVAYVKGADQRAFAGTQTSEVLLVGKAVPAGTAADVVLDSIKRETVAAKTVPADAVTDETALRGLVTTVDLVPGEQLLKARFADPSKAETSGKVTVPKGMQEVSILLEPQRSVGGQLQPGDTVGVFISIGAGITKPAQNVTHLALHKVLVTAVQGGPQANEEKKSSSSSSSEKVLVTLARTAADAEKIVHAQEFGTIWLSKESSAAIEQGTRELTQEGIYK